MASGSFLASWTYVKRRGMMLLMTTVYLVTLLPLKVLDSLVKHRNGAGYFSDPLGKPPLLSYWKALAEFSYGALLVRSRRPTDLALAAAEDSGDGVVAVDKGSYLEFTPAGRQQEPLVGVVILPGAFVPPVAYAPLARTLAQKGHPSYVVRFDFDAAWFGWERIGEIIQSAGTNTANDSASAAAGGAPSEGSTPTKWVLVGHSMGAVAIEAWYAKNSACVHGVVYMGAGTQISDKLAGVEVPAMLLRGSRDPFTPPENLEKAAHKLPKDTETVVVEGGNHRGFAHYTRQPLDWEATINPEEQQRIVVDALVDFIGRRVVAGEPSAASTST